MRKEATCDATLDGRKLRTRAHLESGGLVLRGGLQLRLAPGEARDVRVADGMLVVTTPYGELALELGAAAVRWARELQNPKSVVEKFGVRRNDRLLVRRVANVAFLADLERTLGSAPSRTLRGDFDCIVAQFDASPAPGELETLARHLVANGALWLVTPKGKGSLVPETAVRAAIARAGLVDVKISAFDATHTATKVVIPLAARRPKRVSRETTSAKTRAQSR